MTPSLATCPDPVLDWGNAVIAACRAGHVLRFLAQNGTAFLGSDERVLPEAERCPVHCEQAVCILPLGHGSRAP